MAQEFQGSVNQLTDRPINPFVQGRKSASWFSRRLRLPARQRRKNSNHAWVPPTGTGLDPVTGLLQAIVDIHKEGTLVIVALYVSSFAPQTYLGYFMCSSLLSKHWLFASYLGSDPQHLEKPSYMTGNIQRQNGRHPWEPIEFHLHFDPQVLGIATMWGPGKDNRYLGG